MKIKEFALERYFAKYEFVAKYLLSSSDCEAMTIQDLLALQPGADEQFQRLWLGYTETQGSPTLRQAISEIYQTVDPAEILVHSGAEEAIYLFMHALLEAGDHIIVHWPCYQSLVTVAESIGCQVTRWEARSQDEWALDPAELRKAIRPNSKAIIINSPHNPTGHHFPAEVYSEINHIAKANGLLMFCDEVYRDSEYRLQDRLPAACDLGPHAVSLGVTSKSYGLAGLRIGWIATHNRHVYQSMAKAKDYTTICNSAPSEYLAEIAIRNRDILSEKNTTLIKNNLAIIDGFFGRQAHMFHWIPPKAGPIAFPKYLSGDVDRFCDQLVRETGVLLVPGTLYGHRDNHFRIGFGRQNMPEALEHLEAYLDRNLR